MHGTAAVAVRNQQMVDLGADACLVFLQRDACRAVDCMTTAQIAGIPVVVYGGPTLPSSCERATLPHHRENGNDDALIILSSNGFRSSSRQPHRCPLTNVDERTDCVTRKPDDVHRRPSTTSRLRVDS